MDLLDKLRAIERRRAAFAPGRPFPAQTVIERVLGSVRGHRRRPADADVRLEQLSRSDLHPAGDRGRRAARSSNTAPAPPARGPPTARWRFTRSSSASSPTGSASATPSSSAPATRRTCRSSAACAAPATSSSSTATATPASTTRRARRAAQVIGFRHNSPESLQQEARAAAGAAERNRLVVVEGLYSIRGDVAPLREIVDVCRDPRRLPDGRRGALARHLRPHRSGLRRGPGRARARSTSSSAPSRSRWPASAASACRITRAARAALSGARLRVHGVGVAVQRRQRPRRGRAWCAQHPELRDQLWANIRRLRQGLQRARVRDWRRRSRRSCRFSRATKSARSRCGSAC